MPTAAHRETVAVAQIDIARRGQCASRRRPYKRITDEAPHARGEMVAAEPELQPVVQSRPPITALIQFQRRQMYTMTGEDTG